MKIALIGYGKMGKMVEAAALTKGHTVVAIIDRSAPQATSKVISATSLQNVDVCIDFTQPEAVLENVSLIAAQKKALVIGTTGWQDQKEQIKKLVQNAGIGVVYGANFSIGVHLFLAIAKQAALLIDGFPSYDVGGFESHHRQKADSPSGTARLLAEQTLQTMTRKETVLYQTPERPLEPTEMVFASLRCGSVPGTHALLFDSDCDTIEVRHTARSRMGFAEGAVQAAEWVSNRMGFYSIEEMISPSSSRTAHN